MSRLTISAPPFAGAIDDLVDAGLGGPAHLDQVRQRNAGDGRVARHRHHGVAVAAEHEGGDVLDRHVELVGEEIAEARRVEHAGHADNLVLRQAGIFCSAHTMASSGLVMQITKAFGAYFLMPAPTWSMTLRLMPSRSSRLMPGLRGTPAVTMHTSAPSMRLVGVGAGELGVETIDRRRLGDVERLALRDAFGDVEQHDVAELLQADEMGQRAADLAGADQRNLVTRHGGKSSIV